MDRALPEVMLFCGSANVGLGPRVAAHLGILTGYAAVTRYSDGETGVAIMDNVRGRDVYLLQPTSAPVNENLMELLLMIDACKRASAERITAVVPYFGYGRQDRTGGARRPITARLVADLLETAGADAVVTMDLHAGQTAAASTLSIRVPGSGNGWSPGTL